MFGIAGTALGRLADPADHTGEVTAGAPGPEQIKGTGSGETSPGLPVLGALPDAPGLVPGFLPAVEDPVRAELLDPVDSVVLVEDFVVVPGATLATALMREGTVSIYSQAGGDEIAWSLAVPTEFGGPRHFLVVGEAGGWLEVQVPVRPNGSTGWVHRSSVTLSELKHRVLVDLSERSVVVWEDNQVVLDTTGAVGRASAPTPQGNFYIRDIFEWDPDSAYGPWVLALSSYSEVIDQINGGDAVVAIHGTNAPWKLGEAASLGCIRLDNEIVTLLAQTVGPGTPIQIVP